MYYCFKAVIDGSKKAHSYQTMVPAWPQPIAVIQYTPNCMS